MTLFFGWRLWPLSFPHLYRRDLPPILAAAEREVAELTAARAAQAADGLVMLRTVSLSP